MQDIGGGILEQGRNELRDVANQGFTQARNYRFGDVFDPTTTQTNITNRQNEFMGNLEGNIRGAVGGEQFFNTDDLISRGGAAQGVTNPAGTTTGLLDVLSARNKKTQQTTGLGSQGSF